MQTEVVWRQTASFCSWVSFSFSHCGDEKSAHFSFLLKMILFKHTYRSLFITGMPGSAMERKYLFRFLYLVQHTTATGDHAGFVRNRVCVCVGSCMQNKSQNWIGYPTSTTPQCNQTPEVNVGKLSVNLLDSVEIKEQQGHKPSSRWAHICKLHNKIHNVSHMEWATFIDLYWCRQ